MVASEEAAEYLAECFWPGVQAADVAGIDDRANASAIDLSSPDDPVRYLGSLLLVDDEVLLCRFEGTEPAVRRAALRAGVPFERIVKATRSPRHPNPSTGQR